MLHKNIDRETLAATIAQAVVTALANLEPVQQNEAITRESATLNPLAFSRETGYGLNRVRDLLHAGKIKHVRAGRRVLIPRSEVAAFLERESSGGEQK
jgi:excisionase family DNA binding protein